MSGGSASGGSASGGSMAGGSAGRRAELERIVRELLALRRREVELLERLEAWLAESSETAPPEVAPMEVVPPAGAAPEQAPTANAVPGQAAAADAVPEQAPTADAVPEQAATADAAPTDRAWLDEAVDAALRRAFSGEPSPEDETDEAETPGGEEAPVAGNAAAAPAAEEEPAEGAGRLAPRLDPDLLLLQSGDVRAAFPWDQVQEIGLADEVADGPAGTSLQEYLNGDGKGARADEPYRISWKTPDGVAALTCEALGAVIPASVAASRGVELVLLPGTRSGASPCSVLTLVDFLATLEPATSSETATPAVPPVTEPAPASEEPPSDTPPEAATVPLPEPLPEAATKLLPEPLPEPATEPPPAPLPEAATEPLPEPLPEPPSDPPPAPSQEAETEPPAPPPEEHVEEPPAPVAEEPPGEPAPLPKTEPARTPPAPELPESPPPLPGPPAIEVAPRAEYPRGPALVAVRYLPARVAISRVLRSLGWQAVQAPDNQELPAILRQGQYEITFAEPPDPLDRSWLEALVRLRAAGGRVIIVASRVRGAAQDPLRPLGDVPRLLHPFREGDIQRALRGLFGNDAV